MKPEFERRPNPTKGLARTADGSGCPGAANVVIDDRQAAPQHALRFVVTPLGLGQNPLGQFEKCSVARYPLAALLPGLDLFEEGSGVSKLALCLVKASKH